MGWIMAGLAMLSSVCMAGGIPVMVGGENDMDACGSLGVVSKKESTVIVRDGPGIRFKLLDKLKPNSQVWICDQRGAWLGIVYDLTGQECGVSSPIEARRPYAGKCASGWVLRKHIELLAG